MEDKKLEDKEIIDNVLTALRYNAQQFAKVLGYSSHASISHVRNGNANISKNMVNNIIKNFPEVNYFYLTKGELPILKSSEKLAKNQFNLLGHEVPEGDPNYSLETFGVLKNIEAILLRIEKRLNEKSDQ